MKQNIPVLILSVLSSSFLILFCLFHFTIHPNRNKNGFSRDIVTSLRQIHSSPITSPLTELCGTTNTRLFFSTSDPRKIVSTNYTLEGYNIFSLPIPISDLYLRGANAQIDSPTTYIFLNNASSIITYALGDKKFYTTKLPLRLFTRQTRASKNVIFFRGFDSAGKTQVFAKINVSNSKRLVEKQIITDEDSVGLVSDGELKFDSLTNTLLYVQFYQNRFFALDTNLNIIYIGHTIDTTNTNPTFSKQFTRSAKGTILPGTPLNTINKSFRTYKKLMLVISSLKSDNETISDFRNNTVVDTYEIRNGQYKGSFYIPDINHEKVNNFSVLNNILVAMYKSNIATFGIKF